MEHSRPWEADSHSASQENHHILRKPKLHYRVHKSPPLVRILDQINAVHAISSYFLKIHSNIILPLRLRPPSAFLYSFLISPMLVTCHAKPSVYCCKRIFRYWCTLETFEYNLVDWLQPYEINPFHSARWVLRMSLIYDALCTPMYLYHLQCSYVVLISVVITTI